MRAFDQVKWLRVSLHNLIVPGLIHGWQKKKDCSLNGTRLLQIPESNGFFLAVLLSISQESKTIVVPTWALEPVKARSFILFIECLRKVVLYNQKQFFFCLFYCCKCQYALSFTWYSCHAISVNSGICFRDSHIVYTSFHFYPLITFSLSTNNTRLL